MRHLIRRVQASALKIAARVKVGHDDFSIVSDGCPKRCLMDGYDVLPSGEPEMPPESFADVIADLIERASKSDKTKSVLVIGGPTDDVMQRVVERLKESLGKDKVSIKGLKGLEQDDGRQVSPAEFKLASTLNMDALAKNVSVLVGKVASAAAAVSQAHDASLMLTRRRLVTSMWGADKMQTILDGVRKLVEDERIPWSKVEASSEMLAKSSERLQRKLASSDPENGRLVSEVLIPGVNDSYENVKRVASIAAVAVAPLVRIDASFKKNTTYPATWFMSEDMMDGLSQGYDGMLGFLLQVPQMESKVIDPLSFVRMRAS